MSPPAPWAESPTTMGPIAHFLVDPLALVSVTPRATLQGMPQEILLKIVSFLSASIKEHPNRGRWGFEQMSTDRIRLSSTCSAMYNMFRPLRFRSLSLGGGPKSLAFARLLLEDVNALRLITELEITSVCPLHGELDDPYAELISKALNLKSFWYDARHPLPAPFAQALRRLKQAKLQGVHISMAGLESISELAKTRSWKKGGALDGLKTISLEQEDPADYMPGPPWLYAEPSAKWEQTEHALLHNVATFLAHSASTLEELNLDVNPRFDTTIYGHDLPLRTMFADPAYPCPASGPSKKKTKKNGIQPGKGGCDLQAVRADLSPPSMDDDHLLQFPRLRKLVLPPSDLRESVARKIVAGSPELEQLEVTHRPVIQLDGLSALLGVLSPLEQSQEIDFGDRLGRLETLVYKERSSSSLDDLQGIKTPFFVQMVDCVKGATLTRLTLHGLNRVSAENLAVVVQGCMQLRVLSILSSAWEGDIIANQQTLAPLKELASLSFDYPSEQTDPPDEPPPVQALVLDPDEDRLSADQVMDEIDAYFYDGTGDTSDDEDESDESDEASEASSEASWRTGLETVDGEDDDDDWHSARGSASSPSDVGDGWTRGRDAAQPTTVKNAIDPAFVALPLSRPPTPAPFPSQGFVVNIPLPTSSTDNAAASGPSSVVVTDSLSSQSSFSRSQSPSPSSSTDDEDDPDQTVYAGRWQNDNLFHFSGIAHAFAKQHPRLETVEWTFDAWLKVEWTVERDRTDDQVESQGANGEASEVSEKVTVNERVWYPRLMELHLMEQAAAETGALLM